MNWDDDDDDAASLEEGPPMEDAPPPQPMSMSMGMPNAGPTEPITQVNPQYEKLMAAWRAEEQAPELLPWQGEVYETFLGMVEKQEAMVEATLRSGNADAHDVLFVGPLYQMDLARVKYTLAAYVRMRLKKITTQAAHVDISFLSDAENTFRQRFLDLITKHHRDAFLNDLPPEADTFDHDDDLALAVTKPPNLDAFVFVKVNSDLGHVPVGLNEYDTSELEQGDVYVLPYARIRHLLTQGHLDLV